MKFVPVIVTVAPGEPAAGLNEVMVGVANTTKLDALNIVTPLTAIEIFPVVAPGATAVVRLVAVEAVTTAVVLLNFKT